VRKKALLLPFILGLGKILWLDLEDFYVRRRALLL